MRSLRLGLSVAAILFLGIGYLLSVRAALTGEAADYAAKVDTPPIRLLALVLLLSAILLSFVPAREEETK